MDRLAEPAPYGASLLRYGASVGVAYADGEKADADELLVKADIALYRAKDAGRGAVRAFTAELEREFRWRKTTADALLEALEQQAFFALYQPRYCARTGAIVSVEALARWRRGDEVVTPDRFFGVADDIGATAAIDRAILRAVERDMATLRTALGAAPIVSINLSAQRLMQPSLLSDLESSALPAQGLSLELLESILLVDPDPGLLARIAELKARGHRIEVDDFGSGHASILGVLQVRPSALKIDRRLIAQLPNDDAYVALVKAMVDIGAALKVSVVAEGVERAAQARACAELGCDALQGFYYSRPMPLRAFSAACGLGGVAQP